MTETDGTALREDFDAEKSRYNRNILRVHGKMPQPAGDIAFGRGGTPNDPSLTGPADPLLGDRLQGPDRRRIGGRFGGSTRPGSTRADRTCDEPAGRAGTVSEFCSEVRRV